MNKTISTEFTCGCTHDLDAGLHNNAIIEKQCALHYWQNKLIKNNTKTRNRFIEKKENEMQRGDRESYLLSKEFERINDEYESLISLIPFYRNLRK